MYCRKCKYALISTVEPRCAECGTGFDCNNPSTFLATLAPREVNSCNITLGCVCASWAVAFFATLFRGIRHSEAVPIEILAVSAAAGSLAMVFVGLPLGFFAFVGLALRRNYLAWRWRSQNDAA